MTSSLRNLVARRDLVRELTRSEIRSDSADSSIGLLWWFVDPLLMMAIYSLLVVGIFGRGHSVGAPYPLFVLCALTPWKQLTTGVGKCTRVLRSKEGLIKSVPFPTVALPLSVVGSSFVYFLAGFGVLVVATALWPGLPHEGRWLPLVQLPFLMIFQLAAVSGLALATACYGVLVRDLSNVITYLLRAAFYLTPGLYSAERVQAALIARFGETTGERLFSVYMANPFAALVTGYRDALLYDRFLEARYWPALALSSLALLGIGWAVYQHYDRRVIKFL